MRTAVAIMTAVLALGLILGCASKSVTPAAAPPVSQGLTGSTSRIFSLPIGETEAALDEALSSLGMVVVARQDSETGRYMEARRADNTTIFISLIKLQGGTDVWVRVGLFGDVAYSTRLLDAVKIKS